MANRRSFLGLLAGGAVAGPAAANSALSGGLGGGVPLGVVPPSYPYSSDAIYAGVAGPNTPGGLPRSALVELVKTNPAMMEALKDALRPEPSTESMGQGLDPDLIANRSMSLCTKLRLQRERVFARRLEKALTHEPPWNRARLFGITGLLP